MIINEEAYLLLWLEAPLQAWGYDSKFGRRFSLDFPTKSGVLGLLCCALGAGGEQKDWLARWSARNMTVQAYVRADKQGKPISRLPLLEDFQMVGSGYQDKDPWQSLLIPKTSEGKKAVGGGTKLTYRYYLQDMAFAVVLQGPAQELEELKNALQQPVWDIYLGRKNCAPTEFVFQGIYSCLSMAYAAAQKFAQNKESPRALSFSVLEGEHLEGEQLTLNDVPVQFGTDKKYRDRKVSVITE